MAKRKGAAIKPSTIMEIGPATRSALEAKRLVFISLIVTLAIMISREYLSDREPDLSIGAGVLFVGIFLALLVEFAPRFASGLAVLMMATAVFQSDEVWKGLRQIAERRDG